MTNYSRYNSVLRKEITNQDHITVIEEDTYIGLVDAGGFAIHRATIPCGFYMEKKNA